MLNSFSEIERAISIMTRHGIYKPGSGIIDTFLLDNPAIRMTRKSGQYGTEHYFKKGKSWAFLATTRHGRHVIDNLRGSMDEIIEDLVLMKLSYNVA